MSPTDCFTFVDENPLSLNDGYLLIAGGTGTGDRPAVNHGQSSSMAFADGHATLKKWIANYIKNQSGGPDSVWLAQHATCQP